MSTVSLLMAVYRNDDPQLFHDALWSNVLEQSDAPDQLVIVVDGPIPQVLEDVLCEAQRTFGSRFGGDFMAIVRLFQNRGLAAARNAGIVRCRCDYIALGDADDMSLPERLRLQKAALDADPGIHVVTAWQYDYRLEQGMVVALKTCPEEPSEIAALLQVRNPICQPSMMIRKQVFVHHGAYDESVRLLEDYELHLRWNAQGVRYRCLQTPLVRVSVSADLYRRRGGLRYAWRELAFRLKAMRRGHLSGGLRFYCTTALYMLFRVIPPEVRRRCYVLVRRSHGEPVTT